MIANYHTHTHRCNHATGTEEDYVNRAIEGGIQIMGFSDHTPYWFHSDYYSHFRMLPDQLEDYFNTIQNLKKNYVNQIELHLGVEVEYYPAYFDELMVRLRDTPTEYMLLGQHFVGNEIGCHYAGRATANEEILAQYCDQVIEAMQTGLFTYLAHPDLLHFVGEDTVYRHHTARLCREAKACNIPLEINLLGIRSGRHYPDIRFWQTAAQEGCSVVLGCDSHDVASAWDPASEQIALEMIGHLGLHLLETVNLRPIQ